MFTTTSSNDSLVSTISGGLDIDGLRGRIAGDVLVPGDANYDATCMAWNVVFSHRPTVAVVAAEVADVTEAVRFAHAAGLTVTIQASGHGFSRPADGVLIVTSRLTDVEIDRRNCTAHIACGAKWGDVLGPAQEHGLAPLLGSTTDVSAVGYTLGGGMGWIGRRYGLASDSVRSFDIVLPDGTEVRASSAEQPELFWALKGGGAGSFGVVTAMTIELYPVTTVYAGNLLYPIEMAGEVIRRYRTWVAGIDDQLTSSVLVMNFPPLDIVPEPLRGQSFVIVRGCWCGDLSEGRALIDGWREWKAPAFDMFGPMPFSASDSISQDPVDPMPAMVTTEWFDTLSDAAIDVIVAGSAPAPGEPPMLAFAELRHAGGAIRAKAPAAANGRGRSGEFLLELCGTVFSPEHGEVLAGYIGDIRAALSSMVSGDVYLNFLEGAEKHERSADAFDAASMARLSAVKTGVDAANRFRSTLNIKPARIG